MLLIFTLCACSTTQNTQTNYTGQFEVYPAVLKVFEEMHARVKSFDIVSNIYLSSRIYNKKLNIKYNVKVTFDNKIIHASLIDVKQPHIHHKTMWVPYKSFFPLDDSNIRNPIESEILAILNDTEKYNEIKTNILNELGFHYLVLNRLDVTNSTKWIKHNLKGKKFVLDLSTYDPEFRENDTQNVPYERYIAHLRYTSGNWVSTEFDMDLYNNNPDYENMPMDITITTLAEFMNAKVQVYIVSRGFSFIQLVPETEDPNPRTVINTILKQ